MRRVLAVLAVAAALAVTPVFASEHGGGEKPAKANDPGTKVDMPFLIAPMSKDGTLLGYSYISPKLIATSQRAALEVREKIAFIQDAFVRDVNGASIALATDATQVDRARLAQRLVADTQKILGPARVARIYFGDGTDKDTGIQFSPLRPDRTPVPANLMAETAPPAETKPAAAAHGGEHH